MSKDRYIYKLTKSHRNWFCFPVSEELEYFNFPIIRRKSRHRAYLRIQAALTYDWGDFKLKNYTNKSVSLRDPYEDTRSSAWGERKSWKRNSVRKKQYKCT